MKYNGEKVPIRVAMGGLRTDLSPNNIPDTHLIEARNISIKDGILQKGFGSRRWNFSAHSDAVIELLEWNAAESKTFVFTGVKDGTIFRYVNRENRTQITANSSSDPASLKISENNFFFVPAGQESPGNDKKLFVFSKNQQVQVIGGTGITYSNIDTPSADFATSGTTFPRFGIVHRDRLWTFLDHRGYASSPTDHEDFVTGAVQFPIYPGEGDYIVSAVVFLKQLFVVKRGGGVYQLIDTSATTSEWYWQRLTGEFGGTSHRSLVEAFGDLVGWNDEGSITSFKAVQEFGDVKSGDALALRRVKSFLLQKSSGDLENRRAIYDRVNKIGHFALRPADKAQNNAIWEIDFSGNAPEITVNDKDQPNCLTTMSLPTGKERLFYGANDGYIYEMGCEDREIGKVFNPIAPIAALGSGAGSLDNASYRFRVVFEDASANQSLASAPSEEITVSDSGVNGKIELTFVQVDSTGNATKRIVLGKKSTDTLYTKVAEIADNTTTTYTANSDPSTWSAFTLSSKSGFNEAYEMRFQLPHLDFSHVNPAFRGISKLYDFIEVGFISTGRWPVTCEYWIDGIYKRSRDFNVSKGPILDDFTLDTSRLDAGAIRYVRFKLHGNGNAFSAAFSNAVQGENVKIVSLNVYCRVSNEDQKAINSGRKASE